MAYHMISIFDGFLESVFTRIHAMKKLHRRISREQIFKLEIWCQIFDLYARIYSTRYCYYFVVSIIWVSLLLELCVSVRVEYCEAAIFF